MYVLTNLSLLLITNIRIPQSTTKYALFSNKNHSDRPKNVEQDHFFVTMTLTNTFPPGPSPSPTLWMLWPHLGRPYYLALCWYIFWDGDYCHKNYWSGRHELFQEIKKRRPRVIVCAGSMHAAWWRVCRRPGGVSVAGIEACRAGRVRVCHQKTCL